MMRPSRRLLLIAALMAIAVAATRTLAIPESLDWPDRRPIASLVLATSAAGWPRNPRGWFIDPTVDVTTPEGLTRFHQRVLQWADTSITIMRSMGSQGMVTWDVEGEQYPQRTSYIGDPRMVDRLAPEMTNVIDEYFRRFRQAGFRVGVTVRPQELVIAADGKSARQVLTSKSADVLIAKIRYAQARWGASLFYVDSNWGGTGLIPLRPGVFRNVTYAVPGVLLIPEHATPGYFALSAPYSDLRNRFWGTPALVRWFYPHAFSVIELADGDLSGERERVVKALKQGDIVMFRGWFRDPANDRIRELMRAAGK